LSVFAADDTSVQLCWRASPAAGLRVEVGDAAIEPETSPKTTLLLSLYGRVWAPRAGAPAPASPPWAGTRVLDRSWPGGPGGAVVGGLTPGTTYDVVASAEGVPRFLAGRVTTLRPPPGALVYKVAALSDVHVGEKHFGVLGRLWDGLGLSPGAEPYPVRALRAAVCEAAAWGADLYVVKGDLTRLATAAELRDAGCLLTEAPAPVEAVLGNHDNVLGVDMRSVLASQGLDVGWWPWARDVPGARLVFANTAGSDLGRNRGELPPALGQHVAALAGEARTPALVFLHHPPELRPYPTVYPPGLPHRESLALLEALVAAKPGTLISCGHRHRNRRYSFGPLVIAETSSTKDYPGGWAGYKIYEGGVVQFVRRTARPDVIAWTEATRRAMNGQWGRWSPGRLGDRCFSLAWG
jgi:Icc protein